MVRVSTVVMIVGVGLLLVPIPPLATGDTGDSPRYRSSTFREPVTARVDAESKGTAGRTTAIRSDRGGSGDRGMGVKAVTVSVRLS
ncbi:hypothetical protein CP556_03195 [Natrinema sp. CBA1119]|nr:hypothetical protein CP556_03195 [Natrinema sp. CBA1119]